MAGDTPWRTPPDGAAKVFIPGVVTHYTERHRVPTSTERLGATLKIETTSAQHPIAGDQPGSRIDGTAASGAAAGAAAPGKDVVDLSSAARHLSNLQNSGNDINIERVNALSAAIASGQLQLHTDHKIGRAHV